MNKIKVRKLRNVEKSVCCQEQKFAYNIAFRCHISFGDNYKKQMDNVTEAEKNKAIFEMRDFYLNTDEVKRGLEKLKLNKDAVFIALNQGLRDYIEHPFIATDYKEIGERFAIPYTLV
jgi:hypothetical protein